MHEVNFDPLTSDQLFTIAMTDVSHLVLLPQLTNYLKEKGTVSEIVVVSIGPKEAQEQIRS
ncbi:hypothetical protein ACRCKS_19920, partial [Acinetobacter baumannii]